MKIILILFFILLNFELVEAQDCGTIHNGEIQRLDVVGRSLENDRVQDQDGLGTCYANSTSLLLQAALPRHPAVSYLHLSVNYAGKKNEEVLRSQPGSQIKSQAISNNGQLLLDGGFACATIEMARKSGGICSREDVPLEKLFFNPSMNINRDTNWYQLDLLKSVSIYIDGITKDFLTLNEEEARQAAKSKSFFGFLFGQNNSSDDSRRSTLETPEKKLAKFKNFSAFMNKLVKENKASFAKKNCTKPDNINAIKVIKNIIARIQNNIASHKPMLNSESAYLAFKSNLGIQYSTSNSVYENLVEFRLVDNLSDKIKTNYLDPMTSNKPPTSGVDAFKNILLTIDKNTRTSVTDEIISQLSPDDREALEDDFNRYVKKDFSKCSKNAELTYLKSDDGFLKDLQADSCFKTYITHAKNLQQMVIGLDKYNLTNFEKLNDFITKLPELNYEQAMMSLLAPTCSDDKKIIIPENVRCNSTHLSYPEAYKTDPHGDERFLNETRDKFRNKFTRNIMNNRPVSLSICTAFFSHENQFFNKTNQCVVEGKHVFHELAMVGYKCENGKMKYLIQNSWGDWAGSRGKFERDSFGKAWMTEDELVKNTRDFSTLNGD